MKINLLNSLIANILSECIIVIDFITTYGG